MSAIAINSTVISSLYEGEFFRVVALANEDNLVECVDAFGGDVFMIPFSTLELFSVSDPLSERDKEVLTREIMHRKKR